MVFVTHKLTATEAFAADMLKKLVMNLCSLTRDAGQTPADVLAKVFAHQGDVLGFVAQYQTGELRNDGELHFAIEDLMLADREKSEAA